MNRKNFMNLLTCFLIAGTLVCPGVEIAHAQGIGLIAPGHVIGNGGTANPGEATDYSLAAVHGQTCQTSGGFLVSIGGGSASQCSTTALSTGIINGGTLTGTVTGPGITLAVKTTNQAAVTNSGADPPMIAGFITPIRGYLVSGGANVNGLNAGGYFRSDFTLSGANTTSGDVIGSISIGYATQSGPTGGGVGIAGSNDVGWISGGANWGYVAGIWVEVGLNPTFSGSVGGSTAVNRYGVRITSDSTSQGSTNDAAMMWETNATFGSNAGKFANGILLGISGGNLAPLADNGILVNGGIQTTLGSLFNFPSTAITNFIINTPSFIVPGNPSGFALRSHPAGAMQFGGTNAAGIAFEIDAFTGPAQFLGVRADTSSSSPSAVQSGETILSISANGHDGTGYFEVAVFGVKAAQNFTGSNHGSYFTVFTTPLNSVTEGEVVRIQQGLMVGTTTDPGLGIINVATGYRIGNAAASGNVLRGNGTNFVSAQLAVADLSGLPVTVAQGGTNCAVASGTCLDNITGFGSNGIIARTGAGAYSARTITGTANQIAVSNGDGVAGNPTVSLPSAVSIGTSLTVPVVYGGSSAGSTLTLQSTSSGSPSGDSIVFNTGGSTHGTWLSNGKLGIGTETNSQNNLTVSANTATGLSPGGQANALFVAADGSGTNFKVATYGTGQNSAVFAISGRGTAASPTASQSGDVLGFYASFGYDGAGSVDHASSSGVYVGAGETHTSTANGTFIAFLTVANTTIVRAEAGRWQGSGGLSIGTTTDPGTGGLIASGATIKFTALANAAANEIVCYATASGLLTYEPSVAGCVPSAMSTKNLIGRIDLRYALDQISALTPGIYTYRDSAKFGTRIHDGLYADEICAMDENLCVRGPDGKVENYDKWGMIAFMTAAIGQLKADNDNLRAELLDLKRAAR